jgi:threonine synthase
MKDLACPRCRRAERTGAVYPPRCPCGELWQPGDGARVPAASEAPTPLWEDPVEVGLVWKREDLNATGSFKDRGACALVALARDRGATALVLDSSGSAALAGAAAAARAGIPLTVHAPAAISPIKRGAVGRLGARLVAEGDRNAAAARAGAAAGRAFYLSHVHHPAFWTGTAAAGAEALAEGVPPIWVLPVGNGSLLLGLALALKAGGASGVRCIAVQAASCPGLLRPGEPGRSVAAGIAINDPPRRDAILEVLKATGGRVVAVSEEEILAAWRALWRRGVAAETASAAVLAGVWRLRAEGMDRPVLGWLTGSGHRESEPEARWSGPSSLPTP